MSFDDKERKLLKLLVEKEMETLRAEGQTVFIVEDYPGFLAGEEKYEEFLEKLLKKLQ
ncbi:hypothetical protein KY359_05135 [Candidatus Woesearchaeota archaeon]|nr:hypothetical protein [Candidatus Woesearchaeota archaeon]